jgi:hypothetical protein
MPPRIAQLLVRARAADAAVRFELGKLGKVRRRALRGGGESFFLDFRPYGRVWSHQGVQITDEATANRLLEKIRGEVAKEQGLEDVLARY